MNGGGYMEYGSMSHDGYGYLWAIMGDRQERQFGIG